MGRGPVPLRGCAFHLIVVLNYRLVIVLVLDRNILAAFVAGEDVRGFRVESLSGGEYDEKR